MNSNRPIGNYRRGTEVSYENFEIFGPKYHRKNQKKFGPKWYYYSKKISYKYNMDGFRAPEFSTVDWANSVVVLGDSYALGMGNAIEDIFTTHLEKLLGLPVINLGVSGSAIDRSCWNSVILHDNFPHPKAIVQLWTGTSRYTEYDPESPETHGGQRLVNYQPAKRHWCYRHEWQYRSMFYVQTDRALWKDKTIYYEATWHYDTAKELAVDFIEDIDLGRDLQHWGYKTHQVAAEIIASNLKKQGLK